MDIVSNPLNVLQAVWTGLKNKARFDKPFYDAVVLFNNIVQIFHPH